MHIFFNLFLRFPLSICYFPPLSLLPESSSLRSTQLFRADSFFRLRVHRSSDCGYEKKRRDEGKKKSPKTFFSFPSQNVILLVLVCLLFLFSATSQPIRRRRVIIIRRCCRVVVRSVLEEYTRLPSSLSIIARCHAKIAEISFPFASHSLAQFINRVGYSGIFTVLCTFL